MNLNSKFYRRCLTSIVFIHHLHQKADKRKKRSETLTQFGDQAPVSICMLTTQTHRQPLRMVQHHFRSLGNFLNRVKIRKDFLTLHCRMFALVRSGQVIIHFVQKEEEMVVRTERRKASAVASSPPSLQLTQQGVLEPSY